jgi:hypothetical protein
MNKPKKSRKENPMNNLFTVRVSKEAFESLKVEARLTNKKVSHVIRSRIEFRVRKSLGQTTEREELIRAEIKKAMHRAVKMSDMELSVHTQWLENHIECNKSEHLGAELAIYKSEWAQWLENHIECNKSEHLGAELAIYKSELAHRGPLSLRTNIFDRLPPFKQ